MKYFTKEVKIGLAGIAAIFILIYGINYLKGIHLFKPTSYFYVKFKDINGLVTSSPVYADGYKVGLVRKLIYDYEHSGNVVAEIQVDPDLRIPKGSTAELSTGILGGVDMTLLLANNPREKLAIGDTIYGEINNGVMGKAADMVPQVQAMLPKLDSILVSINTLLADPALTNTLHNVEQMTAHLAVTSKQLEMLSKNDLPKMTGELQGVESNFLDISNNLKEVNYAAAFDTLQITLNNIKALSDKLTKAEGNLGLLLNDTALYNNITSTSQNASLLLDDIRQHPKRYINISVFGGKSK